MPGTTTYYSLNTYSNSTEDEATSFYNYRLSQSGPSGSNMTIIDGALHAHDTSIAALQATRGAITVAATYVSPGYYEATVASITSYVADMPILLKLSATSSGTTTLKINALATKSLLKINYAGTTSNLTGEDLIVGRYYLFRFDSVADAWIWVNQINTPENGWTWGGETWTYASATTFTIAGVDRTSIFTPGTKIKLTQSSTVKYFYVTLSAFSTNTTVTVTGGDDYSLANAAITENYYSRVSNPTGFPYWFTWTPTYSASGSMTYDSMTTTQAQFRIIGKECLVRIRAVGTTGGTASNTLIFTLPVTCATASTLMTFAAYTVDSASIGGYAFLSSTTQVSVRKYDASNYGLGSTRALSVQGSYDIA